ncbi:dethiobiotin synthase [Guyparkeria halophila]|uniref:ATP-dependent dethiobiotin synthetase BioD n=1 Tax=Guyparkeria halophila TaxID=47960 RepID=A0ABZ0YXU9_9GAMM|nr:dethiobiotin synthase [Guyparkeria halophila]WQH16057.1 dethiobiotin synthase [Guyparkeria halophila]
MNHGNARTPGHDARGWVVLATDTGVGKTVVSCALARLLIDHGLLPRVRKPVETGCKIVHGERLPADGIALREAADGRESLEAICPIRYLTPVAAPEAARREGETLSFKRDLAPILDRSLADLPARERVIIESAGGLLSPLADDALNVRLAEYADLPSILVTPDRLGTLSSTLTAVESLHQRQLPIAAIILNRRPNDPTGPDCPDNAASLREWLPRLVPTPPPVIAFHDPQRPDALLPLLDH